MKNAILLHGMNTKEGYYHPKGGNASEGHWFSWLRHQLMIRDIFTAAPDIPLDFNPQYDIWTKEFERYDITPNTILVGHSCGAGFLVRWLSEHKGKKVGKVILVAPWLDPECELNTGFFDFKIDPNLVKRTRGVTIFYSDDDDKEIQKCVGMLKEKINNISLRQFHNLGHFTFNDMKTNKFPELLKEILK